MSFITFVTDTSNYVVQSIEQCRQLPPPEIPAEQYFPTQEPGTRISRALPYQFVAEDKSITVGNGDIEMVFELSNTGTGGAPFMLLDITNLATVAPRQYTVEGGRGLSDTLLIPYAEDSATYHLTLVGPNGFARELLGNAQDVGCVGVSSTLQYKETEDSVVVVVDNRGGHTVNIVVTDNAYGSGGPYEATLASGKVYTKEVYTKDSGNWYDLTAAVSGEGAVCSSRRFMGRMETGKDTISDPAMAAGVSGLLDNKAPRQHPPVPERLRTVKRNFLATAAGKDSVFYDDPKDEL